MFRVFLSISFFWGLSCYSPLFGQKIILTSHQIDSFQQIVQQTNNDSIRHGTYYALAKGMATVHLDSSKMYAQELIQLAEKTDKPAWQVRAWRLMSEIFNDAGLVDSITYPAQQAVRISEACRTEDCFLEKLYAVKLLRIPLWEQGKTQAVIQLLEEFHATPGLSEALKVETRRLIAFPLIQLGDHDGALKELNLVWTYSQKVDDQEMMCHLLFELRFLYYQMENIDKALSIDKQRLEVCQSIGKFGHVIHCLGTIGTTFHYMNELDSALFYFQKQQQLAVQYNMDSFEKEISLNLLGVALASNNIPMADKYALELLAHLKKPSSSENLGLDGRIYDSLCNYYQVKNNDKLSLSYAQKHMSSVRNAENDTTEAVAYALEKLTYTQASVGDFESAWHTFDTFYHFKIALINRNQQSITAQTSVEMNLAENELARQKAEQATLLEQ